MVFGMHKHYIKEIFTEYWDPHQLNIAQAYGNKKFYDHLQKIGMMGTQVDLVNKYAHPSVKKYKKELVKNIMAKKSTGPPISHTKPGAHGSHAASHGHSNHSAAKQLHKDVKKTEKGVKKVDKKIDKFFDKVAKIFD